MNPELTVIVPCYNEADRIDHFFRLIEANPDLSWEWLFVDDGSTDNTAAKIKEFCASSPETIRLISYSPNRGKGAAVREGLLSATGDLVGFVDADLAASPLQFKEFCGRDDVRSGKALLLGIRLMTQEKRVKRLAYRHVMGRCFQTYVSLLTGLKVYDTQCGFKLMARDAARKIAEAMECDGFAFDVEMIMLAIHFGLAVREEPVAWEEQGHSSVRPHHVLRMALAILRIRKRIRALNRG